jgi:nitroreductase
MQLAAWDQGIGSGLFTGVKEEKLRDNFAIPMDLNPSVIVGFGYPARKLTGKRKNRLPYDDLVFYEKYGRTNKQV